jgi:MYXO-CTERM domain-containing protein
MNRKLLTAVALAAGPLLWASAANADEITLAGPGLTGGPITFTNNGGGIIGFSLPAPGFGGTGAFVSSTPSTGTFLLGPMSGTAGPATPGNLFPVTQNAPESFEYTATSPLGTTDMLIGNVTWPDIKDDSTSPSFDEDAVLNVTSVAGSAIFKADFPVGVPAEIDFTVDTPISLEALAAEAVDSMTTGTFSAGEVACIPASPGPCHIPEPASLTIIASWGAGLMGLGWLGRRRRKTV